MKNGSVDTEKLALRKQIKERKERHQQQLENLRTRLEKQNKIVAHERSVARDLSKAIDDLNEAEAVAARADAEAGLEAAIG